MTRAWILLLLLAACRGTDRESEAPAADLTRDIHVVAVPPVLNESSEPRFDGVEFADILASEVVKFAGFRVVRPRAFRKCLEAGEKPASLEEVLRAARRLQADAILIAAVTHYDPYDPPKIGVSVQFLRLAGRNLSAAEIDRIVQSASWRSGPVPLGRERAGQWIAAFEDFYDAHDGQTRKELQAYARAQATGDTPFPNEREFLAVQSRYLQFVSSQILSRLFDATSRE